MSISISGVIVSGSEAQTVGEPRKNTKRREVAAHGGFRLAGPTGLVFVQPSTAL
jgi:hypothetical protein